MAEPDLAIAPAAARLELLERPEAPPNDDAESAVDPSEAPQALEDVSVADSEPSQVPAIVVHDSESADDSIVEIPMRESPPAASLDRDLPAAPEPESKPLPRSGSAMSGVFADVSLEDRSREMSRAASEEPTEASAQPLPVSPPRALPQTPVDGAHDSQPASPATPSHATNGRPRAGTLPPRADGRPPLLSGVLIVASLEALASSKEARRSPAIRESSQKALDLLRSGHIDENTTRTVFEPLKLACETKTHSLQIAALDCIGKLVSHAGQAVGGTSRRSSTSSPRSSIDAAVNGDAPAFTSDPALADEIVSAVCGCFIDQPGSSLPTPSVSSGSAAAAASHGPDAVNLHILSALLALILSSALPVHQSSLLKAVRTVYNVFLLSRGQQNQMVAQAALGQIVGAVFGRVKLGGPVPAAPETPRDSPQAASAKDSARSSVVDFSLPDPIARNGTPPSGLGIVEAAIESHDDVESEATSRKSAETIRTNLDGAASAAETSTAATSLEVATATDDGTDKTPRADVTPKPHQPPQTNGISTSDPAPSLSFDGGEDAPTEKNASPLTLDELHVKDAFLVFRALCKLSMKPLGSESERDVKSHAMRSKLLSLQLILTVLHLHMPLFVDQSVLIYSSSTRERTQFVHAIKQYLCLSVSRNAVSSVIGVFELSCEIFWRVLSGMRTKLKKEIEVLLNEIFLPILEMRNSTVRQKSILLGVMSRLCHDPQALVEIYLNYDCDRSSLDNVYERLMNIVSKMGTTQYATSTMPPAPGTEPMVLASDGTPMFMSSAGGLSNGSASPTPPAPPTPDSPAFPPGMPYEVRLRRQSLDSLVAVLRSLVVWAGKGTGSGAGPSSSDLRPTESSASLPRISEDREVSDSRLAASLSMSQASRPSISGTSTPDPHGSADDPSRFENAKQRKTTLLEGIKKFNFKPKRGIAYLIDHGFIRSNTPQDIARFLLHADGLNKAMIGEWLGEGDDENIATMHAFVDLMDFAGMHFVDALRLFLQSFRLPGESQKIDRFMLKFAERFVAGNPTAFATADTAYVLSYSVIMLNTDLYNPQNKRRMTKAEFVKNNRGINEGQDLPEPFLLEIYDEIATNEIRMKDEIELPTGTGASSGIAGALSNVGRDFQREAYALQSEGMISKTEALFRTMVRSTKRGGVTAKGPAPGASEQFFSASHFEHVRPMFTVAWMPILAGISAPLQESTISSPEELEVIARSLEGFKQAIKIVCLFDLELERNAFVTTLSKFTFLNNLSEMRAKNVEAIKTLLGVAMIDGNYLKSSWKDVITCVSQLERFQLISQGVDSRAVPEVGRRLGSTRSSSSKSKLSRPTEEVARETGSRHITIAADRVFSSSNTLSGTAIVDFVRALSEVSWDEIQSSGPAADQPRTFCLQKLVEISYYNMDRIRLEWSSIWALMGDHFNQVCCHSNVKVSFFALDSLRQMASHFLEKDELANFKFQQQFLMPFKYAMEHNNNVDVRDMILQCFRQLIQARVGQLRSGWRTMFGVFSSASKVLNGAVLHT